MKWIRIYDDDRNTPKIDYACNERQNFEIEIFAGICHS